MKVPKSWEWSQLIQSPYFSTHGDAWGIPHQTGHPAVVRVEMTHQKEAGIDCRAQGFP